MKTIKANWNHASAGWWTAAILIGGEIHDVAVCKERDRKWHSYVDGDTMESAPGFRTMKLAMANAELRTERKDQ